jgi:predicted DNA-binding transcriptional regulator YafY
VKRIDRLGALVDELRGCAPHARTAAQLAVRFDVSNRTIERDIVELQRSGVPIWARPGPLGGYTIDAGDALPALDLTLTEAAAVSLALSIGVTMPYAHAARSARAKLLAALSASAVEGARDLAVSVALLPAPGTFEPGIARMLEQAVLERTVLVISWRSARGSQSDVEVEPLALAGGAPHWYLVGWYPGGPDAGTVRLDHVTAVRPTGRIRGAGLPVTGERFTELARHPDRFER